MRSKDAILGILLIFREVSTFGFDNEIIGPPQLECNPDDITFLVATRKPFRGSVFVRGHFDNVNCRRSFESNLDAPARLSVRLGDCGMKRMRQLQPLGFNMVLTFVANFHPLFATKQDRAFSVRCFYANTNAVVKADIAVSPIPAETMEKATVLVPKCEYTIREGALDGPPVRETIIGKPMYHRWDCENTGNFGILIRNCAMIDSRLGESVAFLDANGCPIYREFPPLEYDATITSAYTVIEAMSFPDQGSISFACQIQLCDKRANECLAVSPPRCALVTREEYAPHSIVNNAVYPTEVISTFDGVQENMLPLDMGPQIPEDPWLKEPVPVEDGESTSARSGRETTTPVVEHSTEAPSEEILLLSPNKNRKLSDEVTTNQLPPWPIPTHSPEEVRRNALEYLRRANVMEEKHEGREKRLADKVMDVASELVVRQEDEDEEEVGNWHDFNETSRPKRKIPEASTLTCISDWALVVVGAAFASTSGFALFFIFYISRQLCSKSRPDFSDVETVCPSERSSQISVASQFPVFSRRLGHPCYNPHLQGFT
ncbi:unnamed protein product [Caenorhabditis auriculariae]|uniref:ZP domain-containing protein n=1 Tax=Caenorhabditis auriculariae TaxID=2777116 RepID=A0A8S1GMY9_9PELO|nr:unnamed protein product [Caenorhabditis auriculariae]